MSNGGVYVVIWHSIPHQVLVQFDREALRNPPHAHSAKRLAVMLKLSCPVISLHIIN